jgi:hypothetical protein
MSQTKNSFKRMMSLTLLASMGFAALLYGASPLFAATAPLLGTADSFGVLAALSAASANMTTVSGDLGLSPGLAISRTGPWTVGGTEYFGPLSLAATAQADALSAFNNLAGQGSNGGWGVNPWSPVPGVWTVAADTTFAGTITLTGLATDVWVFQVGRDMTFSGSVIMAGDAQACNVFWQIGRSATIASGSTFVGTLIASADVTLVSGANVEGRIISLNGALTTDGNNVTVCSLLASTTLSNPVPLPGGTIGAAISDTKTLSGGTNPTGTITFYLYGPNDDFCTLGAIFTSPPVTVNGNGDYGSGPYTPTAAGTYRWIAAYSGDGSNAPSTTLCNDLNESVVVTAPVTAVPTLNEWGVIIFMLLVGLMSIYYLRRQKAKA